jgi:hypothetical protein
MLCIWYGGNMEQHEAEKIVRQLLDERAAARRDMDAARNRLDGFDTALKGYFQVFPALRQLTSQPAIRIDPSSSALDQPRGQAAITQVLEAPEFEGRHWTVAQLTEELQRRGWEPDSDRPNNVVRVALSRLVESNPRILKGPGDHGIVYYYQSDDAPPPRFRTREAGVGSFRI